MKDRIKFYVKMIVFHLVLYPLVTWFLVSAAVDRIAQNYIIWIFAIGMVISMTWSCIIPIIKLRKQYRINKSQQIMREDVV